MNVNITHVIVHEPAQARQIIVEALEIASELSEDPGTQARIFEQACNLLGQRWTFANVPQPFEMSKMALLGNMGRH